MSQPWRGIFVIVVTPFTENYELDEESLRKASAFLHRRRGAWTGRPGQCQRIPHPLRR